MGFCSVITLYSQKPSYTRRCIYQILVRCGFNSRHLHQIKIISTNIFNQKPNRPFKRALPEQVRLIDESGQQIGVFSYNQALQVSQERGFDLIPVTEKVNPPIYKLGNLGKLKYQQDKELRKQSLKQSQDVNKIVQIGFNEGSHDLEFKVKRLEEFLEEGKKVGVIMKLKGREKAHKDLAFEKFDYFLKMIKMPYKVIQDKKANPTGIAITIKK